MQNKMDLKNCIDRIKEMEAVFDMLLETFEKNPLALQKDAVVKEQLERLIEYYESSLWMEDFRKDEQGLIPKDLKRGVLSEDGIYNLLSEIR